MTATSPSSPDDTPRKTDFNLTRVAAAALAAVTAALLGSMLGAAGTIIGAAGASVITTVGTAVYEASLRRSRVRVRSLAQRPPPSLPSLEGSRTERFRPEVSNAPFGDEHGDEQLTDGIDSGPQPSDRFRRFATLRWGALVVGALGAFLLALVFITGFEWASGEAVGGNGKGTTIGQVINNPPSPRKPSAPPVPLDPATPPSGIPTATPTPTPTEATPAPETSTTAPDDGAGVESNAPKTSKRPTSSEVTPTPSLIPPVLPGVGR
jgi:hypothetical protein